MSGTSGRENQQSANTHEAIRTSRAIWRREGEGAREGAQNTGITEIKSHPCSAAAADLQLILNCLGG